MGAVCRSPKSLPQSDSLRRFGHWIEQKQAAFDAIMREYDVQLFFADRMRSVLCGSKKVIIIDNSGSMNSGVSNTRR
jgi:hypothetical protein